jgi:NAD(P)H-hydrate epimerase
MKIFTKTQIKELDQYTIANEPVKSIDLMERAAKAVALAIAEEWSTDTPIVVFAGPGNNGGDALAVARILAAKSYSVTAYLFNVEGRLSEDCDKNARRAVDCGYLKYFVEVKKNFDPPILDSDTLIIDGLFGIGLDRPLGGGFASLVQYINQSGAKVVSIDIPSGMMADSNEGNIRSNIIKADITYTFQQKKLAFFMADNQPFIGQLRILDIGLSKTYLQKAETDYRVVEKEDLKGLLRPRSDFANKGTMGHALIIAGSYGMAGAAILSTKACLRSGVGKVTVLTPQRNYAIMQMAVPEAIVEIDHDEFHYSDVVTGNHFDAIGIGPGIGQDEDSAIAMSMQIRRDIAPMVLDADALNILASHSTWLQQLPRNIIMTPHPGELDRLCGSRSNDDSERLAKAMELAQRVQAYIILKGHYSALCLPSGKVIFNCTGNSGMATAGSGDVLTGIITALLARGYSQLEACLLGMYLHGRAGDMAAEQMGRESLISSDIIDFLPKAFLELEKS